MAMQTKERTRLTIDIEPELLREIKIQAIRHDESVKNYVTRIVLEELEKLEKDTGS